MKATNFLNTHLIAIKTTIEILKNGKIWLYFIPSLLVCLFFLLLRSIFHLGETSEQLLNDSTSWYQFLFGKIGALLDFFITQLYIFIVITILSPVNTMLSEKVDTLLTGNKFTFSLLRLFNDFVRMIFIVIIALTIEFSILIAWWLFAFIFGLTGTLFYEIITLFIGAFFFGFTFYDHSLERYQVGIFQSIGFAFTKIPLVLTTGIIFKTLYYFPYFWDVPYLGIMLAPIFTTIIATVVYLYDRKILPKKNDYSSIDN